MTVKQLKAELTRRGVVFPPMARKVELEALLAAEDLTVVAAVDRDLELIAKRDPLVVRSALAATARALAREMDDLETSATAKSLCAKALRETLDRLGELAPVGREDKLDELTKRRRSRIEGSSDKGVA